MATEATSTSSASASTATVGEPLSTSAVQDLWSCEQRFVYSQVQRISPKMPSVPMRLGQWVHLLIAAYYQSRSDPTKGTWLEAHQYLTEKYNALDEGLKERHGDVSERAYRLMEAYLHHYLVLGADEGWEDFEVVAVEQSYSALLRGKVPVSATVDLLGRDRNGILFIMETKTGRTFPYSTDMLMIEPQMTAQIEGARSMGYDVRYGIYNYIRSEPPSVPKFNKDGSIKKVFGKLPSTDYSTFMSALIEEGKDPKNYSDFLEELKNTERNKYFRRVQVGRSEKVARVTWESIAASYPRAQELRMAPDLAARHLGYRCGFCPYRTLCHAEIMGYNAEYVRQTEYESRQDDRDWLRGEENE